MTTSTESTIVNHISGNFNIQDIKYDLLKIIEPHDGLMYNRKDSELVKTLFDAYLGDLANTRKIYGHSIYISSKDTAITFDVTVRMNRERSPKKLKIHVGKLVHYRDRGVA